MAPAEPDARSCQSLEAVARAAEHLRANVHANILDNAQDRSDALRVLEGTRTDTLTRVGDELGAADARLQDAKRALSDIADQVRETLAGR